MDNSTDILKRMWFLRKMLKISYPEHVTNEDIPRRSNSIRSFFSEIVNRQVMFFGHVVQKD